MTKAKSLEEFGEESSKTTDDQTSARSREESANQLESMDKLEKDIAFLKDRLQRMKKQRAPNKTLIRTYEDMLSRRLLMQQRAQSR